MAVGFVLITTSPGREIEVREEVSKFETVVGQWIVFGMHDLFVKIENSLELLGFPKEQQEYIPHITLARIKYPQKWTPDVSNFLKSSYDPIDFPVDRVQFFSSELLPSGTIYTLIKSFPLGETL